MIMFSDSLDMHILGDALYVDIDIWDTNAKEYEAAFLTFDTGATVTTISSTALEALGYDISTGREHKITTGSGVATVREVTVDKLRIGSHYVLENVKVYAHTFPDECFTMGVVGLNVLSQFDILLSFRNKIIKLAKIDQ